MLWSRCFCKWLNTFLLIVISKHFEHLCYFRKELYSVSNVFWLQFNSCQMRVSERLSDLHWVKTNIQINCDWASDTVNLICVCNESFWFETLRSNKLQSPVTSNSITSAIQEKLLKKTLIYEFYLVATWLNVLRCFWDS